MRIILRCYEFVVILQIIYRGGSKNINVIEVVWVYF